MTIKSYFLYGVSFEAHFTRTHVRQENVAEVWGLGPGVGVTINNTDWERRTWK